LALGEGIEKDLGTTDTMIYSYMLAERGLGVERRRMIECSHDPQILSTQKSRG
jgi:hypothetical protein